MGLVVHVQVAGEAGDAWCPGNRGVGIEVYPGQHVVRVRALSHTRQRSTGETRTHVDHIVKMGNGHHLDLGRPIYVHELSQQVLDFVVLHPLADFLS